MSRERTKSRPLKGGAIYKSKPDPEKYKKKPGWKKFYTERKKSK